MVFFYEEKSPPSVYPDNDISVAAFVSLYIYCCPMTILYHLYMKHDLNQFHLYRHLRPSRNDTLSIPPWKVPITATAQQLWYRCRNSPMKLAIICLKLPLNQRHSTIRFLLKLHPSRRHVFLWTTYLPVVETELCLTRLS